MLSVYQTIPLSHFWVHPHILLMSPANNVFRPLTPHLSLSFCSKTQKEPELLQLQCTQSWNIHSCSTKLPVMVPTRPFLTQVPMKRTTDLNRQSLPRLLSCVLFFCMFLQVRGPSVKSAAATAASVAFTRARAHSPTHTRARTHKWTPTAAGTHPLKAQGAH